ncbi:MAG: conjugal transfer protein TraD, partial [Rhodopseudomonas sp.]|nr:conjugal transfer protein TraD [Rhodopseudomonas sp.]
QPERQERTHRWIKLGGNVTAAGLLRFRPALRAGLSPQ